MIDMIELMLLEKMINQLLVKDGTFDESSVGRNVFLKPAAQIVKNDDPVPGSQKMFCHM
jgi:hypothetical protein